MHQLPVILAGQGVEIAPAQEADVVRLDELIHGCRVGAEFLVVHPDRALVLQAPLYRFELAVVLDRRRDARCGYAERKRDKRNEKDDREQDVPVFGRKLSHLAPPAVLAFSAQHRSP